MTIVSLAAPGGGAGYPQALNKLLAPFKEMFLPAPASLIIYLGELYPAGPQLGVNPHPALAATLCAWAYEAGVAKIQLAARAAPGFDFAYSWQMAGYDALNSSGAALIDLAHTPGLPRLSRLALTAGEFLLPQALLQAEFLINMAKFRAGSGRLFGSALHNLAALAHPRPAKANSARELVDLYSILLPDLHLVDALRGSGGWQPVAEDALLAATDAAALDMTLAAMAAVPLDSLEEITLTAQYGLGNAAVADIILLGDTPALFPEARGLKAGDGG